jgi:hypothetical protein
MSRIAKVTLIAAVAALFAVTQVAWAADKSHTGKVVSVTAGKDGKDGKLVMKDDDDKEHTHAVPPKTTVTLNKKSAKLEDLKKGDLVTVSTDTGGKVTTIAATRDVK